MLPALPRYEVKYPGQPRDWRGRFLGKPGGPATPKRSRKRDSIAGLLLRQQPATRPEWATEHRRVADSIDKAIGGEYADITVDVDHRGVEIDKDHLYFSAELTLDGKHVGDTAYTFTRNADGQLVAEFALLELDDNARGRGFAGLFVGEMEDWSRESGVAYIGLDAALSGGGYAWASRGYDWWDESQPGRSVVPRLAARIDAMTRDLMTGDGDDDRDEWLAGQILAGRHVLNRLRTVPFGQPGYPTPYEVSQTGRRPGQPSTTSDPGDWWIGKQATMGSYWRGVKRL